MAGQKIKNTFLKGMNKDRALTKADAAHYREASNVRLLTDDSGDSMGSVSTIRGNLFDFAIPDTSEVYTMVENPTLAATLDGTPHVMSVKINFITSSFTYATTEIDRFYEQLAAHINAPASGYEVGITAQSNDKEVVLFSATHAPISSVTTSPADINAFQKLAPATDLQIIGQTKLREQSVLFTCPKSNNGSSQIWRVDWNNQDVPTIHLVRNAYDLFSTEHDIEARSRYELPEVQRVYYTDDKNPLRTLNVYSDSSFLDRIDINPDVKWDIPIVTDLNQTGGLLPTGWYTYAYRYKNLGGSETNFSRFSAPFPIMKDSEETTPYLEFTGNNAGDITSKSLSLIINNIDTNFEFIDIVVGVMDSINAIPIYTYVKEDFALSGAKTFTFTHNEIDDAATLSEAEITIIDTIFTRCKTIAIKDNRLIAGNLKDDVADITDLFDAESYRYELNSRIVKPFYATTGDKVNPFNKDSTSLGGSGYQSNSDQLRHKRNTSYQLGGTGRDPIDDLGGVDFGFVTKPIVLDTLGTTTKYFGIAQKSPRVEVKGTPVANTTRDGVALSLGNGKLWNNFKNPFIASHFRGYMRSETYRFGIVFFDKSGRSLDVKWIADIRMPEHSDPGFESYKINGTTLEGKSLGVEFTVRIPTKVKDIVSGFSIVRAERKQQDETIIGQGLMSDITYQNIEDDKKVLSAGGGPTGHSFRADRLLNFGMDSRGDLQPFMDDIHTLCVPQLLIKNRNVGLAGYKIRPIAGVAQSSHGRANSNWTSKEPTSQGYYYKLYYSLGRHYFNNISPANNPHSLGMLIESSAYLPAMDEADPAQGEALRGAPYENGWIGSVGAFINYSGPWSNNGQGVTDRDLSPGTAQIKFAGRGGHAHFVNLGGSGGVVWKEAMCSSQSTGATGVIPLTTSRIFSSPEYLVDPDPNKYKRLRVATFPIANQNARTHLLFNLYKELPNQYGGASVGDVARTEYISTGHYQAIDSTSPSTIVATVYGGDTYVNVYDQMLEHVNDNSAGTAFANFGFKSEPDWARGAGAMFVVESRINLAWRQGPHLSTIGSGDYDKLNFVNYTTHLDNLHPNDVDTLTEDWEARDNNSIKLFSKSEFSITTSDWDNRTWASDPKINGESSDSWRSWKVNNFWDVDGNHGPINKLETFNDTVYYFQDTAFGKLQVNPNPIIQGSDDIAMALGQGGLVIHDNNYISTNIGSKHQWSVFTSPRSIYWFDIVNKKPYKFDGSIAELSDIKGMHSFFVDNVDNNALNIDNPANRHGIRGVYDTLNSEALFTFMKSKTTYENTATSFLNYSGLIQQKSGGLMPERSVVALEENKNVLADDGSLIKTVKTNIGYDVIKEYPISATELIPALYQTPEYLKRKPTYLSEDFTLAFSEIVDAWGAFYDFAPTIYVTTKERLLTPNQHDSTRVHLHNVGPYNKWYGDDFKTHIEVVSIIGEDATKVYDNLTWHTTANSKSGAGGKDFDQLTFDKYYAYNDYQHTGEITLNPAAVDPLLRRVEREWQMAVPRNVVTETVANVDVLNPANWDLSRTFNDRIRDKYLIQHFEYDNSTSDKFTIDYLHTTVRLSKR